MNKIKNMDHNKTNDDYKKLSCESKAFKEQIEKRMVGYKWDCGEFALSYEFKTEAT